MTHSGQTFLRQLAEFPPATFERRFLNIATRLDLGAGMDCKAFHGLFRSAFLACLCNIAFNGLGGCDGATRGDREDTRRTLEHDFMDARDGFFGSAGWKGLTATKQAEVARIFLKILVTEGNLAH